MIRILRTHFGRILGIGGVVAFALGVFGFRSCFPELSLDTIIYRTVQLFYWGYSPWDAGKELPLPWTLAVARWLAPAVLLGALFSVAISVFEQKWQAWCIQRMRGHTIVCGAGEKGGVLVADLQNHGHAVVVIDPSESISKEGRLVVTGDATERGVLTRAGIAQASRLVALTGDDHDNLAIAVAAAQAAGADTGLSIFLHSGDASLCDLYQRNRALTASLGGVPVRVFNHYRNVARRTLQDFPLNPQTGQAHLILPGLSRVTLALAVEYALVGHFPEEKRTHIHLAGPNAEADLAKLRMKYPNMDQCVYLHTLPVREGQRFSSVVAEKVRSLATDDCFAICPGTEDDNEAFGHALELYEMLSTHLNVQFLLDTLPGAAVRRLVEASSELKKRISFLPTGQPASGYEAVIGDSLDRTARIIHDNWLAETRKQIAAARAAGNEDLAKKHEMKGTYRQWGELTEEQKGANRSQADHIAFKLRAVGLDPASATSEAWARLNTEEVEALARVEHARWAAYLWMTGWTYAPERNDLKKQHPNLVPYDDLDEPTKDYDREAVRNLCEYLPRQINTNKHTHNRT
ncbi:MAG: NAD-binding protein [Verrucomicrobiaceae bacterium]|nr:NAD-binding protein [Verrucomicrobiaceae bacterium]